MRKPADALFSVMVIGSIFSMRAPSGLPCSFRAIGFSAVVAVVLPVPVPVPALVPVPVVALVPVVAVVVFPPLVAEWGLP